MDDLVVEHVLRAVECVPAGQVVTYGRIAELVGGTARQVGSVMRFYGSNVAWWRVVNASGRMPPHLWDDVEQRWATEGITARAPGMVDLTRHLVDEAAWVEAYEAAAAGLPPYRRPGLSTPEG